MAGILLTCTNCYSTDISIDDNKKAETGGDWFTCDLCENSFELDKASYEEQ